MLRPLKSLASRGIAHAGLLLAMVLSFPHPALAWGDDGHQAIGWIATKFLMPDVATKVEALLAHEDESSFASATTWADRIKHTPEGRGTDKWHYVDIPVDVTLYDRTRDCMTLLGDPFMRSPWRVSADERVNAGRQKVARWSAMARQGPCTVEVRTSVTLRFLRGLRAEPPSKIRSSAAHERAI